MSKKDIYWGFILILIALYIVVSSVGLLPKLPVVKIVFTILFAAWAIKGLCTLSSFEFFRAGRNFRSHVSESAGNRIACTMALVACHDPSCYWI